MSLNRMSQGKLYLHMYFLSIKLQVSAGMPVCKLKFLLVCRVVPDSNNQHSMWNQGMKSSMSASACKGHDSRYGKIYSWNSHPKQGPMLLEIWFPLMWFTTLVHHCCCIFFMKTISNSASYELQFLHYEVQMHKLPLWQNGLFNNVFKFNN